MTESNRPEGYQYSKILFDHIDKSKIFSGEVIYPRQLEIHLPSNHIIPCNFKCAHCQGRLLDQPMDPYEPKALKLMRKLNGKIPFHIYGGAYTEPLLNPYFLDFLKLTKETGSNFGIHTNGSVMYDLEKSESFISTIIDIATTKEDYVSFSLDAGNADSHKRNKRTDIKWFDKIISAVKLLCDLRKSNSNLPTIRVCYLMNGNNSSPDEIENIVNIMKEIGPDSLRFSVPYDLYGKDFKKVRSYKNTVELPRYNKYVDIVSPYLTTGPGNLPDIFTIPPFYQDVDRMNYKHCIYGYYQITLAADGYVYRCSSTASPSFPHARIGRVPDNIRDFEVCILKAQTKEFDPNVCFSCGARCNRMALEINTEWEKMNE